MAIKGYPNSDIIVRLQQGVSSKSVIALKYFNYLKKDVIVY